LKVVISTNPIQAPMTGIGEYTLRLIEALLEGDDVDELYAYNRLGPRRLLEAPGVRGQPNGRQPDSPFRTTIRRTRRLTDMLIKRATLKRMQDVVYHEPNYLPAAFGGPTVVTIHDLSHIHYAHCHPRTRVMALERLLPRVLEKASAVITVSEYIAGEIREQFALPTDRVHAVHHGVDPSFRPLADSVVRPVLERHGLSPGGYLLCLATLEPRKNLDRLISAFEALPAALRARYPLVLAGGPGWRNADLRARIDRLEARGELRYLGYVPAADRAPLYAGAHGFAYPALYEGFGLPPLEAMACGTPVMTSNRSAMPEVAGEAALAVDPENVEAMTEALQRLCEDEPLRKRLRDAGPFRAAQFSWSRCAAATAAVYRGAAA
jgi:alpha-1,3-rhamnosyl/mannosyltransferase